MLYLYYKKKKAKMFLNLFNKIKINRFFLTFSILFFLIVLVGCRTENHIEVKQEIQIQNKDLQKRRELFITERSTVSKIINDDRLYQNEYLPKRWELFTAEKPILSRLFDDDKLWIGLKTGIIEYDFKTGKKKKHYFVENLSLLDVRCILKNENEIVFGILNGIVTFDKETDRWYVFDKTNGNTKYLFTDGDYLWVGHNVPGFEGGVSYISKYKGDSLISRINIPADYIDNMVLTRDYVWILGMDCYSQVGKLFQVDKKNPQIKRIILTENNEKEIVFNEVSLYYKEKKEIKIKSLWSDEKYEIMIFVTNTGDWQNRNQDLLFYNDKTFKKYNVPERFETIKNILGYNKSSIYFRRKFGESLLIFKEDEWKEIKFDAPADELAWFQDKLGVWIKGAFFTLEGEKLFEIPECDSNLIDNKIAQIIPLEKSILLRYNARKISRYWPNESKWEHYEENKNPKLYREKVKQFSKMEIGKNELFIFSDNNWGTMRQYSLKYKKTLGTDVKAIATLDDIFFIATDRALYELPKTDIHRFVIFDEPPFEFLEGDSQWRYIESSTFSTLNAVDAISSDFVMAVGSGGTIILWDGNEWKPFGNSPFEQNVGNIDRSSLIDVAIISPMDIWILSKKNIYYWNGKKWNIQQIEIPSEGTYSFEKICMVSKEKGFILGKIISRGVNDYLLEYDNGKWTVLDISEFDVKNMKFSSIQASSKNNIWIGGYCCIFHFDGKQWSKYELDFGSVKSINIIDASEIWFSKYGIYRIIEGKIEKVFNERGWIEHIKVFGENNIWLFGNYMPEDCSYRASIIKYNDGSTVKKYFEAKYLNINDIEFISPYEGWCVCNNGIILHFVSDKK